MGNKFSCGRDAKRRCRTWPEGEAFRLSPMMELYGVEIACFIQEIHDNVLLKKKHWGNFVALDLRFPNKEPGKLVAATAKDPADSKNRKEMLKKLKSVERSACDPLNWEIFWNFVDERFEKTGMEFEDFKQELVKKVNRGRISVDHFITKTNPSVYWPSKDPNMRLIRMQLQFHDLE